ncbi:isopentenyl-diphosphate Delta-isomerase [Paraburkholderia humisilvae]|uniref:Isopentenyl-diphosphate Delta-isomerase n=1 Tax=Paraburkholderia humisilvae TaxID=627669 RepID=A0A6J5DJL8_9BURK|nr:isopentenyl-diphosphate Delta-isomerase [Paraburkholderia humisilvae]CAB3753677.1 Isopentenyl-diphosphate Delta-isomerase [Paraburkholderia humisilvae]
MENIEVILVDEHDCEVGTMEKLAAHLQGRLHRAISVYVFNSRDELLLQRRATSKYHCGGLWTNTCCGHPLPGELTADAAHRRLFEEMNLNCELTKMFEFSYRAALPGGLIEHEFGHIFFGRTDSVPVPARGEADAFMYRPLDEIQRGFALTPQAYAPWFKLVFPTVLAHFTPLNAPGSRSLARR